MTDKAFADAQGVISEFLRAHERPTTQNWDELLSKFPQFAEYIVDAALIDKAACAPFEEGSDAVPLESGELFANTVSNAVNLVYSRPSPQLKRVQEKIASFQGPAIRRLGSELGIQHAPLLNGVLAGTISPPGRLLRRLGEHLESPIAALREAFSQSFCARTVPAYKSEDGKPSVSMKPTSWESAVRSLGLGEEETKSLLAWNSDSE